MKPLTLILFFLISAMGFAQNPFKENTTWGIAPGISDELEEARLWEIDSTDFSMHTAYQRIHFRKENQFYQYNIMGCGLDCWEQIWGEFSTTDKTIQFTINKTIGYKRCNGEIITNKTDVGTYHLIKDDYSLRLVKNLNDEPKENYFENIGIEIPDFEDKETKELMNKYKYLYNRAYQIVANKNHKKYQFLKGEAAEWMFADVKNYYEKVKKEPNQEKILQSHFARELYKILQQLYDQIEPKKT